SASCRARRSRGSGSSRVRSSNSPVTPTAPATSCSPGRCEPAVTAGRDYTRPDESVDPADAVRANNELWDEWTRIHEASAFYDLEGFKRGGIRLSDYERDEIGDVAGLSLLHLQCHFGIDSLSWARLGANVTGADFSQAAIDLATRSAGGIGLSQVTHV